PRPNQILLIRYLFIFPPHLATESYGRNIQQKYDHQARRSQELESNTHSFAKDKIVLVTGWYSGISFIAALELARMSTLRHAGYYT
ncbi:hypothetical protein F443_05931, partial [Phytophthora nicotianae P1569]